MEIGGGEVEELGTACSGEIGGDRGSEGGGGGARYSNLWGESRR